MRTRSEYLIQKRDGRLQGLRATKLARSLQRALSGAAEGGSASAAELALELAEAILRALGTVERGAKRRAVSQSGVSRGSGLRGDGLRGDGSRGEGLREERRSGGVPSGGSRSAAPFRVSAAQLAEVAVGALRQCGHPEAAERFLDHRAREVEAQRGRSALRTERSNLTVSWARADGLTASAGSGPGGASSRRR